MTEQDRPLNVPSQVKYQNMIAHLIKWFINCEELNYDCLLQNPLGS